MLIAMIWAAAIGISHGADYLDNDEYHECFGGGKVDGISISTICPPSPNNQRVCDNDRLFKTCNQACDVAKLTAYCGKKSKSLGGPDGATVGCEGAKLEANTLPTSRQQGDTTTCAVREVQKHGCWPLR